MTGDWRHRAACRDEDPELFFPIGESGPALRQAGAALAVCARCPVRSECLTDAIEKGDLYGVRGGLTERELRAEHRRWKRARGDTSDPQRGGGRRAYPPERIDAMYRRYSEGITLEQVGAEFGGITGGTVSNLFRSRNLPTRRRAAAAARRSEAAA